MSTKIPKTVRQNWVDVAFWTEEKRGKWDLRFQQWAWAMDRSWGRAEHTAGKFLLQWDAESDPASRPLAGALPPTALNSSHAKANILRVPTRAGLPSLWMSQAGKEEGQRFFPSLLFLNNQLKNQYPKGSFRVLVPFYFLQWECSVLIIRKAMKSFFTLKKGQRKSIKVELIQMTNKHEKFSTC